LLLTVTWVIWTAPGQISSPGSLSNLSMKVAFRRKRTCFLPETFYRDFCSMKCWLNFKKKISPISVIRLPTTNGWFDVYL
jgi:hypothetical protein